MTYALKILLLIAIAAVMISAVLDFVGRITSVAIIVIGAVFFTYVIYPLVRRLNTRLPLIWSILIVYAAIVVIVVLGVSFVLPPLYDDTQSLVRSMPQLVQTAQAFFTNPHNPLIAHLPSAVRSYLATVPPQLAKLGQQYAATGAAGVFALLLSVVGLLATVVVIPVISVYLMIEAPDLLDAALRGLPPSVAPQAKSILRDIDKVLGGFIRGQITVGATIGAFITLALLILHVKYALLIGVVAGIFDIIPYVGAIVGFVPSVTLAFFNDGWQHALIVAVVFVLIFQAEGHFIAPKIVSDSVGLSPLMVIVAILIGGDLLGITGMFLAVPIAAVARVVLLHAVPRLARPLPAPPAVAETRAVRPPDAPRKKADGARV